MLMLGKPSKFLNIKKKDFLMAVLLSEAQTEIPFKRHPNSLRLSPEIKGRESFTVHRSHTRTLLVLAVSGTAACCQSQALIC